MLNKLLNWIKKKDAEVTEAKKKKAKEELVKRMFVNTNGGKGLK